MREITKRVEALEASIIEATCPKCRRDTKGNTLEVRRVEVFSVPCPVCRQPIHIHPNFGERELYELKRD
jgi:hypothetical protein